MKAALLATMLMVGIPSVAWGQASTQPPAAVTPTMISEGEPLYKGIALCFACHGPTGKGVPGAGVNLTDAEWLHGDGSFDGILAQILAGVGVGETKSGVIMLPRGGSVITDDQARAVAAYVWSLRRRGEAVSPPGSG